MTTHALGSVDRHLEYVIGPHAAGPTTPLFIKYQRRSGMLNDSAQLRWGFRGPCYIL